MMTSSAKNSGLPSCLQAEMMISYRCRRANPGGACSSRLCTFSTITTASSVSTPIDIAMPANDMMFAVSPMKYIGMNASVTAMGNVTLSHLTDRNLYPFTTLQTTGTVNPDGDRAFDEEDPCESPSAAPIRIHRDD